MVVSYTPGCTIRVNGHYLPRRPKCTRATNLSVTVIKRAAPRAPRYTLGCSYLTCRVDRNRFNETKNRRVSRLRSEQLKAGNNVLRRCVSVRMKEEISDADSG